MLMQCLYAIRRVDSTFPGPFLVAVHSEVAIKCQQPQIELTSYSLRAYLKHRYQSFPISAPSAHTHPSPLGLVLVSGGRLLVYFDATSREPQSYSAGHLQGDPSQSLLAWRVWFPVVLPAGTSRQPSPPSTLSRRLLESNMLMQLVNGREEKSIMVKLHYVYCIPHCKSVPPQRS